jgi:hypothetical protein
MAGVTTDIKAYPYGIPQNDQLAWPVGATQQLYEGCVALQSGGSGGITQGYLKNAATAYASDICVGLVDTPAGGTYVPTGPGILGGSTDGSVWANVRAGTFMFQSGTGADLLSATTNGKTVYYGGENASGPIACATSNSGARPALGVQFPQDPGFANNYIPGSNYWPIKMNVVGGP